MNRRPFSATLARTFLLGRFNASMTGTTRMARLQNWNYELPVWMLRGTVATVRLEMDNWTGHRFTDFFTLLKVDGEWKIMNKVFHLHP